MSTDRVIHQGKNIRILALESISDNYDDELEYINSQPEIKSVEIELTQRLSAHEILSNKNSLFSKQVLLSQSLNNSHSITWLYRITNLNIYTIENVYHLAKEQAFDISYTIENKLSLNASDTEFIADFIENLLLKEPLISDSKKETYEKSLVELRPEQKRKLLVFPQKLSFIFQILSVLSTGAWGYLLSAIAKKYKKTKRDEQSLKQEKLKKAVLIGAYGGEHVGDAAILGGVLIKLHQDYGIEHAELATLRPLYTPRWVNELDTPIKVNVFEYSIFKVIKKLRDADCLVYAGGPLMDLPMMLVRHQAAAAIASFCNKPFIIDRIGVGPFIRYPSRFIARNICKMADYITVRTSKAAEADELKGLAVTILQDPAFGYLETRQQLSRLSKMDTLSIEQLLDNTKNRTVIGINLRPIRHEWCEKGLQYSINTENKFIEECASGLKAYVEQSSQPVTLVFFPMNPIQIGCSDFLAAYRLHKLLGKEIDFRVWEYDPGIDAVLALLRRCNTIVAMRFHACIFSLSQDALVLGIDYYVEKNRKVSELFMDLGKSDACLRLDQVSAEWLATGIEKIQENRTA